MYWIWPRKWLWEDSGKGWVLFAMPLKTWLLWALDRARIDDCEVRVYLAGFDFMTCFKRFLTEIRHKNDTKCYGPYSSVDFMLKDLDKNRSLWDKIILHPSMNWLRWLIYNLKDVPNDTYRKIKRGSQRAYYGICDEDVWGLDYYLSKVILRGLKKLKESQHGCPILEGYDGENNFEKMQKEWERILDTMIWTFEVTEKIQNSEWLPRPINGWPKKQHSRLSKTFHLMTAEETRKYLIGWKNFQKHYFSLWD